MRFRQLGRSGLTVSEVGLGCNNFGIRCDFDRSKEVIHAALDAGITLFDTADIYGGRGGSESIMGRVLSGHRDEIVLASKFGMDMGTGESARGSRRYIRKAIEASLTRLDTDHLDLYQFHEPDPLTPIEETLAALNELVQEGKVRYIGSSNFSAWQVVAADHIAKASSSERFISAQNHFNILRREVEVELVPAAEAYGIGILPYYPLASGLLTGKFRRGETAPVGSRLASRPDEVIGANFDLLEGLIAFAAERSMELLDLAFAYLLAFGEVSSVIAGATSARQVERNTATQVTGLSDADRAALIALLEEHS